jgi:hypothetical protein
VVVVEGATVDFARRPTTMIIIGIVLALVGLAYLCWLLFALAVYALPLFAGVTAGLATYHSGSGPIGAIIVGLIASSVTLVLGQIALMTLRSPLIRAVIALLFAVPAAVAGYHAGLGLAHIGISAESWKQAMAMAGAIVVAATAWARMMLSALRPTPAGSLNARLAKPRKQSECRVKRTEQRSRQSTLPDRRIYRFLAFRFDALLAQFSSFCWESMSFCG